MMNGLTGMKRNRSLEVDVIMNSTMKEMKNVQIIE